MIALTRRALMGATALTLSWIDGPARAADATPIPSLGSVVDRVPVSVLVLNSGTSRDRLIGASSPIADAISLQSTRLVDGQRVAHHVEAIEIPAGSITSLEPGAMHLMMSGLRQDLVQGQVFPLTLCFEDAGSVYIDVRVRRKQDAAGVPETPPVVAGTLTILHASAPPAPAAHG